MAEMGLTSTKGLIAAIVMVLVVVAGIYVSDWLKKQKA